MSPVPRGSWCWPCNSKEEIADWAQPWWVRVPGQTLGKLVPRYRITSLGLIFTLSTGDYSPIPWLWLAYREENWICFTGAVTRMVWDHFPWIRQSRVNSFWLLPAAFCWGVFWAWQLKLSSHTLSYHDLIPLRDFPDFSLDCDPPSPWASFRKFCGFISPAKWDHEHWRG